MTRRTCCFLSALLMMGLLPFFGRAENQEEFELGCRLKTAHAANVYAFSGAFEPEAALDAVVIDRIPAGTYVHVETTQGNWKYLVYMKEGSRRQGWAEVNTLPCTTVVTLPDGSICDLHENDPNYAEKIRSGAPESDPAAEEEGEIFPAEPPFPAGEKEFFPTASPSASAGVLQCQYVQTGNNGKLHLRAAPDGQSRIVASFTNGTPVTVYGIRDGWADVAIQGQRGYVDSRFLSPGPEWEDAVDYAARVRHPQGGYVNLRRGAGEEHPVLAQVPHGARVQVLFAGTYWSQVRYNGLVGYIASRYLMEE